MKMLLLLMVSLGTKGWLEWEAWEELVMMGSVLLGVSELLLFFRLRFFWTPFHTRFQFLCFPIHQPTRRRLWEEEQLILFSILFREKLFLSREQTFLMTMMIVLVVHMCSDVVGKNCFSISIYLEMHWSPSKRLAEESCGWKKEEQQELKTREGKEQRTSATWMGIEFVSHAQGTDGGTSSWRWSERVPSGYSDRIREGK